MGNPTAGKQGVVETEFTHCTAQASHDLLGAVGSPASASRAAASAGASIAPGFRGPCW